MQLCDSVDELSPRVLLSIMRRRKSLLERIALFLIKLRPPPVSKRELHCFNLGDEHQQPD